MFKSEDTLIELPNKSSRHQRCFQAIVQNLRVTIHSLVYDFYYTFLTPRRKRGGNRCKKSFFSLLFLRCSNSSLFPSFFSILCDRRRNFSRDPSRRKYRPNNHPGIWTFIHKIPSTIEPLVCPANRKIK